MPKNLNNNVTFYNVSVIHCYLNDYNTHMLEKSIAFLKSRFGYNNFWIK